MRLRTVGAVFLLAACAHSSTGFSGDAGKSSDSRDVSAPLCGDAGQSCCGTICNGTLVCLGDICGTNSGGDGSEGDADSGCPFVLCHGLCTDVQSDSSNCGLCNHDCQGTSCSDGLCQARGIAAGTSPMELVVDTTHLYFTDVTGADGTGTVNEVLSGGGTVEVLATAIPKTNGVAVEATYVYLTSAGTVAAEFADGAVLKVPIAPDGGGSATPIPIATSRQMPQAVVVDGSNVYWLEPGSSPSSNGALLSCPLSGCPSNVPTVLVDILADPYGLAIDSTSLYVTCSGGGQVVGIDKATGTIRVLAMMQNQPEGVAVANGMVYWATTLDGLIQAVPVTGDAGTTFIATTMGSPQSVAADMINVYWSDTAPVGLFGPVDSCSVTGCPPATPVVLVGMDETATNIAIDSLFVYWIDGNGQILRVAK
jgi:hypothetical protein